MGLPPHVEQSAELDDELALLGSPGDAGTLEEASVRRIVVDNEESRSGSLKPPESDVRAQVFGVVVVLEVGLQVEARCE